MKLLLGLMLLMTAGAASAEWMRSGDNDEHIQYVDRATIRRNGNFVKMWSLADFKKVKVTGGKSNLSLRSQQEYDCKEERIRTLAITTFSGQMGSGTVNYFDSDTEKWIPVPPRSIAETMWKIACGKK